jgi:hypothetical protein
VSTADALLELAEAEIVGLHAFFVAWFTGQKVGFDRVESALHADFSMVTPEGLQFDRTAILARLSKAQDTIPVAFEIDHRDGSRSLAGRRCAARFLCRSPAQRRKMDAAALDSTFYQGRHHARQTCLAAPA